MVKCTLHIHVSDVIVLNFGTKFLLRREECKTREIPISGKGQNRNFDYKIVISVKNLKFIFYISDDEKDFIVGIVSRNLANTSNFIEFLDIRDLHVFQGIAVRVS